MKRCPTCQRAYPDERLKFCRVDGAYLMDDLPDQAEEQTRLINHTLNDAPPEAPEEMTKALHPDASPNDPLTTSVLPPSSRPPSPKRTNSRETIDTLAILPLVNDSDDLSMEYFSDGVTESIINALSQLPELNVMARSTAFRYKGRDVDPQKVGRELGVRAVITGRARQIGDNLNVQVELVETTNGWQLWGEHYNRKLADIFEVQEEIAREISEKLRMRLSSEEKKRLAKRHTDNPEAYQLYLKGRYHWNKRSKDGTLKSIEHFRQAIESDPSYALAHAGLADGYALLTNYAARAPEETFPKARAAAMKALEIDDTLAETHSALGWIKTFYEWDWVGAERAFERAIELNPNYAIAHEQYAAYLSAMERFDESIAIHKRAQKLDPLSVSISEQQGWPFYYSRQYDLAIEQFCKTLEMDPNFQNTRFRLGLAYAQKGMYEEAVAELQKSVSLSIDRDVLAGLGYVYAVSGRQKEARGVLEELQERAKTEYVPPYDMAVVHIGLDEKEEAFEWLEKGYAGHDYWLIFLKVDPLLDSLRSDRRFTDLLRRMGLASQLSLSG